MAQFPFRCCACACDLVVVGRTGEGVDAPVHCGIVSQRVWTAPQVLIRYSAAEYVERAARGESEIPGFTQDEVRSTAESMYPPRFRRRRH